MSDFLGIHGTALVLREQRLQVLASNLANADTPGFQAQDLDLIIFATSTPDMVFPSAACILQNKLGANGCPAFDVQAVCSGFVYALTVRARHAAPWWWALKCSAAFWTSTTVPPVCCLVTGRVP